MVDADIVAAKLAELPEHLVRIRDRCPEQLEALAADRVARDIVAFSLMHAVQTCLDIAPASETSSRQSPPQARPTMLPSPRKMRPGNFSECVVPERDARSHPRGAGAAEAHTAEPGRSRRERPWKER